MKKYILIAAALLLGFSQSASADVFRFDIAADQSQEVPATGSLATGSATAFFDTATGIMTVNGTFTGLQGNVSNAHIHGFAAPGVNAGVKIGLTFSGTTSGTISGSGAITGDDAMFTSTLVNGLTYLNIHSVAFAGGEIRGRLFNPTAVPEPGSVAILALASLSALAVRRRR